MVGSSVEEGKKREGYFVCRNKPLKELPVVRIERSEEREKRTAKWIRERERGQRVRGRERVCVYKKRRRVS